MLGGYNLSQMLRGIGFRWEEAKKPTAVGVPSLGHAFSRFPTILLPVEEDMILSF